MKRITLRDIITLGKATKTEVGFIEADATFSRTGCQDYSRRELGLDGEPNDTVTLYRPAYEVFSPEALKSLDGKPLTLNHPPEDVTADNWKRYAIGDAHGVKRDGDVSVGKVVIRDAAGVRAFESGTRELSVGYSFDLDMTPGTAPDGKKYQGVQRNIRANHHAVVDEGRCGGTCRIGDGAARATDCKCNTTRNGDQAMPTMRKITTDAARITDAKGTVVSVPGLDIDLDVSTAEGAKAADAIDRFARGIKDCMAAHDSVKAEVGIHKERADAAERRLSELDAMPDDDDEDEEDEVADKKGKDAKPKLGDRAAAYVGRLIARAAAAKDEKVLEARAKDRQKAVDGAKKILGDEFKADDKSTKDVRIAALAAIAGAKDGALAALKQIAVAVLGDADPTKAPNDKLTAAFDAVIAAKASVSTGDRQTVTDAEREVARALTGGNGNATGGSGKPVLRGRDHLANRMFGGGETA